MKVGILGLGTVGGGVVNVLQKNSKSIKRRTGAEIELVIAGVRDLNKNTTNLMLGVGLKF